MAISEFYLSKEMIRDVLLTPYPLVNRKFIDDIMMNSDRWPQMVRYDAHGVNYVPRDHYRFPADERRPSDCVWIVPGSTP